MQSSSQEVFSDQTFNWIEIVRFLIDARVWISVIVVACLCTAALYLSLRPALYEASTIIQVAMVDGKPVEEVAVLNEKIKLPLYFSNSTLQTCARDGQSPATGALAQVLKSQAIKNTPFLNLSVKMAAPEQAKACLTSMLTDIQTQQAVLAEPLVQKQATLLNALKSKLAVAEEISNILTSQGMRIEISNNKFAAAAMLLANATSKDKEIKKLNDEMMALEIAMSPAKTSPASLAAPIYTPLTPAGVQPWLVLLLAAVVGLFLGILTAWIRMTWPRLMGQLRSPG